VCVCLRVCESSEDTVDELLADYATLAGQRRCVSLNQRESEATGGGAGREAGVDGPRSAFVERRGRGADRPGDTELKSRRARTRWSRFPRACLGVG
jgi:hypothetical protein